MIAALRENWVLLLLLSLAGLIFWFFGCPFLRDHGVGEVCIVLYALVALIFVFGRAAARRRT